MTAANSSNAISDDVMRQVTAAMVRQEKQLMRPQGSYKKLREELDPAFVTWHKTRMLWLKRLCTAPRNRRKCGARRCLACFLEKYPEECVEYGLEGKVTQELMDLEYFQMLRGNVREIDCKGGKIVKEKMKKRRA